MKMYKLPGGGLSTRPDHDTDAEWGAEILEGLKLDETEECPTSAVRRSSGLTASTAHHPHEAVDAAALAGLAIKSASSGARLAVAGLGSFPVKAIQDVADIEDSVRKMQDLCLKLMRHGDYLLVRDDYCKLSIRLNQLRRWAPAYRPQLKVGEAWGSDMYKKIHRDQVVIDLHWCHANMHLAPQDAAHIALLSEHDFDFDLAWSLAGKNWKSTYRASEAMCLTVFQQCQMLTLRAPELEAHRKSLGCGWRESKGKSLSKIATVRRQVAQWAESDKRIAPPLDDYVKLWLARELLGPGTAKQQIAELHALMVGGEVKDRATIRDRLKSMDRRFAVAP